MKGKVVFAKSFEEMEHHLEKGQDLVVSTGEEMLRIRQCFDGSFFVYTYDESQVKGTFNTFAKAFLFIMTPYLAYQSLEGE